LRASNRRNDQRTGRYLKEKNPKDSAFIGADPYGSVFKTYKETGKLMEATPYLVEASARKSFRRTFTSNTSTKSSTSPIGIRFRWLGGLAVKKESSARFYRTNAVAALQVARDLGKDDVVVFLVADTGERYYQVPVRRMDEREANARVEKMTVGLINQLKDDDVTPHIVSVAPNHKVADALQMMKILRAFSVAGA